MRQACFGQTHITCLPPSSDPHGLRDRSLHARPKLIGFPELLTLFALTCLLQCLMLRLGTEPERALH